MGVTKEQINEKYKKEDANWDFSLFPAWLERKGIPNTKEQPLIATTLEHTLLEFSPDTLPDNHDTFDNVVLLRALINKRNLNNHLIDFLGKTTQDSLDKAIAEYDAEWNQLNKLQKIWLVITGRA